MRDTFARKAERKLDHTRIAAWFVRSGKKDSRYRFDGKGRIKRRILRLLEKFAALV
jgi:hypothetical protein